MNIKKALVSVLAVILLSNTAHGAIIDHGDYLTDDVSGLDWLDVTKSVGLTYNQVTSQTAPGGIFSGWRYATGLEFNALIANATGTPVNSYNDFPIPIAVAKNLISLLGNTHDAEFLQKYGLTFDQYVAQYGQFVYVDDFTIGMISDSSQYAGFHTIALIEHFQIQSNIGNHAAAHWSNVSETYQGFDIGSYLVRASTANSIPEPTSLLLFGAGLLCLPFSRKLRTCNRKLS